MRKSIEEALKAAKIQPLETELVEGTLRMRFADTDSQLKARDVIQAKVGTNYVVA